MIEWRHDFHRYPELGMEKHRTASRSIGLRAEMDALAVEEVNDFRPQVAARWADACLRS